MLFAALTIVHKNFLQQFRVFVTRKLLAGIALLFFIPLFSGLWSSDSDEWLYVIRIKLPLFILPLAFAGRWKLTKKQWQIIAYTFLIVLLLGTCWSMMRYLENVTVVNDSYLQAKSIATPLENDHVRFSWLVNTGIILCGLMIYKSYSKKVETKPDSYLVQIPQNTRHFPLIIHYLLITWFIIYLHILSARTGLLSFYISILLLGGWWIYKKRNFRKALIVIAVASVLPFLAWQILPTFQNRVQYILYELPYLKNSGYLAGGNDASRMLSLQAGWNVLQEHPLGVGAGDVYVETDKQYEKMYPGMKGTDRLYPSSEWLIYGGTAGWAGVVAFMVIMLIPFFKLPAHHKFFWLCLNATAAFSFMFDIGLEVQFGVFIYAFIVLWWWKWLTQTRLHEK